MSHNNSSSNGVPPTSHPPMKIQCSSTQTKNISNGQWNSAGDNTQNSLLVASVKGEKVGVGSGTLYASIKGGNGAGQFGNTIKAGDPRINKLVYNMYRGLLNTKHERATNIVDSAPQMKVCTDQGVGDRVSAMMRHQAELKEGKMDSPGGPPPPPPPPPFQVPGSGSCPPKPVAEPTPVRAMPSPQTAAIPAALAGAMMKDKKPFTYTPGGLDLSEIKSPRMQRRLQRNASLEGVRPSPLAQQPAGPQGTAPPMHPSGMVQVLPMPGLGLAPKVKPQTKEPPKPKLSVCGPPPPPPPFGVVGESNGEPSIAIDSSNPALNSVIHDIPNGKTAPELNSETQIVNNVDPVMNGAPAVFNDTSLSVPSPPPPPEQKKLVNNTTAAQIVSVPCQSQAEPALSQPQTMKTAPARINKLEENHPSQLTGDSASDVTGSSSPFYPEDQNSVPNPSEDSLDINTTSPEPDSSRANDAVSEKEPMRQSRWGSTDNENSIKTHEEDSSVPNQEATQNVPVISRNQQPVALGTILRPAALTAKQAEGESNRPGNYQRKSLIETAPIQREVEPPKTAHEWPSSVSRIDRTFSNNETPEKGQSRSAFSGTQNSNITETSPRDMPRSVCQIPITQPEATLNKNDQDVRLVRQSSLPVQPVSPHINSPKSQLGTIFIPPISGQTQDDESGMSPRAPSSYSPGSAALEKPLPWMVGVKKENTPPPEFMKQAQKTQQRIQRQRSLPQQGESAKSATAPWRHPRQPQSSQSNIHGDTSIYKHSNASPAVHQDQSRIIPPPDVFRDLGPANYTWNNAAPTNQAWQNQQPQFSAPRQQPYYEQQQPYYEQQQPQFVSQHSQEKIHPRERIIPIMLEDSPPTTPNIYGAPPRFSNRVPSSPVKPHPQNANRSYSNESSSYPSTPTTPGSAFIPYSPSYPVQSSSNSHQQMQQNLDQINAGFRPDQPHQNGGPVYVQTPTTVRNPDGGPMQSRAFRVIQNAYGNQDYSGGGEANQPDVPRTYTGSNIPSRSFKVLQAMTDNNVPEGWSSTTQQGSIRSEENIQHADSHNKSSSQNSIPTKVNLSSYSPSSDSSVASNQKNEQFNNIGSRVAPSYTSTQDSRVYRNVCPKIVMTNNSEARVVNRALSNRRDPSPRSYEKAGSSSPSTPGYRSVSLGPDFGSKQTYVFNNNDSPSRLLDIIQQESKFINENSQPNDTRLLYGGSNIPSKIFRQLQNEYNMNDQTDTPTHSSPTSSASLPVDDICRGINKINVNGRPYPHMENDSSRPSSSFSGDQDEMIHDGVVRTAVSKQSVLKELTSHFDPKVALKKPRAAPGRVFRYLQEQYDSSDDQDDQNSYTSSEVKSSSSIYDTSSPSITSVGSEKYEVQLKPYDGTRIPGRTFRMLQENINTHPSLSQARK